MITLYNLYKNRKQNRALIKNSGSMDELTREYDLNNKIAETWDKILLIIFATCIATLFKY